MRFSHTRLGVITAVVLFILFISYTTEPRRRSISCKTFWSCVSSRPHRYSHTIPANPQVSEREESLRDGTVYFTREMAGISPGILLLVLNKDRYSWSKDFRSTDRSVYDFLDLLTSTGLDFMNATLAMMTSSREEFIAIKKATESLPFARIALYYQEDKGPAFPYHERHNPAVQYQRRAAIAGLRNYLMLRSLGDEEHIFWVDADVVEFSRGILQAILSHSERREDAGIITARCQQHLIENYDKNAWSISRYVPLLLGSVKDDERESAVEQLVGTRHFVDELIHDTSDDDLLSLDSVGGTLLYIRSRLVHRGLTFPTYNVVGTTWTKDGWIGVETEGICYAASHMEGGGCFVLGGSHHVRHADLG